MIGTVGVDTWLWWRDPTLRYYCGLSGILNSLLTVGLLQHWRELRHPLILLPGVGAAVKILVEINTRPGSTDPPRLAQRACGSCCGISVWVGIRLWDLDLRYKLVGAITGDAQLMIGMPGHRGRPTARPNYHQYATRPHQLCLLHLLPGIAMPC
jgi:hypothetical protein